MPEPPENSAEWDELDRLIFANQKVRFIHRLCTGSGCTIPEAQDVLVRRYDSLRRSRPEDFEHTHEDYWADFHS